jgi:hypothetical protein
MKKLFVLVAALVLTATSAVAASRASLGDAKELVTGAAGLMKTSGEYRAFQEFENGSGRFVDRDLRIRVYAEDGRCVANGADPKLAGKIMTALPEGEQAIARAALSAVQGKDAGTAPVEGKDGAAAQEVYAQKVGRRVVAAVVQK